MMNRRTFMRWLGFAPVAAVAAVVLPKIAEPQWYHNGDPMDLNAVSRHHDTTQYVDLEAAGRYLDRHVKWRWK